jgi:hypothetical protein
MSRDFADTKNICPLQRAGEKRKKKLLILWSFYQKKAHKIYVVI